MARRGPYKPAVTRVTNVAEYEMEIEANLFAMHLMMPEDFVRDEVRWVAPYGFDLVEDPAVKILARKFNVSEQLMLLRLVQLGYFNDILRG